MGAFKRASPALREFLLIVAGVLAALAAQAWWDSRGERNREHQYISEIIRDLASTERRLKTAADQTKGAEIAAAMVLRSFYVPGSAVPDSVLRWVSRSQRYNAAGISVSSARALIATGDLRLIRDDSVRTVILQILDRAEEFALYQRLSAEEFYRAAAAVNQKVNRNQLRSIRMSPDSVALRAERDSTFPIPPGAQHHPFQINATELLKDREMFQRMEDLHLSLQIIDNVQRSMASTFAKMRGQIERRSGLAARSSSN